MGPSTQNLGIPHKGAPALGRGVRENCELHLERPDRDSRSKKRQAVAWVGWLGLMGLSEQRGGVNQFVRPREWKCHCNGIRCRRPSGMRPEAQSSDPMNWDTCVYDRNGLGDIWHAHAIISRALDTGSEALPWYRCNQSLRNWISWTGSSSDFPSFNLRPTKSRVFSSWDWWQSKAWRFGWCINQSSRNGITDIPWGWR